MLSLISYTLLNYSHLQRQAEFMNGKASSRYTSMLTERYRPRTKVRGRESPSMTMTSSLPWSWSLSILDQRRVPNPRTFQWSLNTRNYGRIFNRDVSFFISPNIGEVLKYPRLFRREMNNVLYTIIYGAKSISRFLSIASIGYYQYW